MSVGSSTADAPSTPPAGGPVVVRTTGVDVDLAGHPVLRGIDLSAQAGQITAIVGPNGSGKSTLIGVLAGLIKPRAGHVERAFPGDLALVPQDTRLSGQLPLTVGELIAMGRWRRAGFWRPLSKHDRTIIDESLETVGLTELRHRPIGALSGGQRQRALLAQGLAQRARLLLLDEPMSALDDASVAGAQAALAVAMDAGAAVVVVTHDLSELSRVGAVVRLDSRPMEDSAPLPRRRE
jgi:zinc/manganese transport system ATP-binding protein